MTSHRDVMIGLALEHGWTRGVELGLGHGHLFRRWFQECPTLSVVGVDMGKKAHRLEALLEIAKAYPDRCTLHLTTTDLAAPIEPDGTFDFVFIDAGHSFKAVMSDITHWESKVKPGGWFGGHDYNQDRFPGVCEAVDACFPHRQLLPFDIWYV